MGMFDRVLVTCPDCSEEIEFQSKAGHCNLDRFYVPKGTVPMIIALALEGQTEECECGCIVTLVTSLTREVKMDIIW